MNRFELTANGYAQAKAWLEEHEMWDWAMNRFSYDQWPEIVEAANALRERQAIQSTEKGDCTKVNPFWNDIPASQSTESRNDT